MDISQGGYRDMQQMQETGGLFLYKEKLNSFITGSKARRKLNTQSMSTVSLSLKTTSKYIGCNIYAMYNRKCLEPRLLLFISMKTLSRQGFADSEKSTINSAGCDASYIAL
ncbi:uncharacterized protein RAG0_00200 [Rhynchosporium agropyri]|uniref:Uncharacterized protein n=1 Tax=Rhynchosporium agropyri TaxID=914238 RepID=A0A1E1JS13_9HELO|nr:uncharacterized protein RAG0_00200 [Rhynchosporium agropyri]